MLRIILLAVALLFATLPVTSHAQEDTTRFLEEAQRRLDGIEAELKNDLDENQLAALRGRIDPLQGQLGERTASLQQTREAADRRLAEIAPAQPKEGETPPAEAPELVQQRADQTALRQAAEAQEKQARLLLVRAEQAATTINERRRSLFTARIFDNSRSILDPSLWSDGAWAIGWGIRRLSDMVTVDLQSGPRGGDLRSNLMILAAACLALVIVWPLRRLLEYLAFRLVEAQVGNPKLRRSALAFASTLVRTGAPSLAALAIGLALEAAGLLPGILGFLALHLLRGIAFVALANGLSFGLLQPYRPALRLAPLNDKAAMALRFYPGLTVAIFTAGKYLQNVAETLKVPLSGVILSSAVFAVACTVCIAAALKAVSTEDEPATADDRLSAGVLRTAAWLVIFAALGAVTIGYVQLASFLVDQLVWISMVGAILFLLLHLVDDALMAWAQPAGMIGRFASRTVGVRSAALERIAVLLSGMLRALLIVVAVLLVLAPWGVQSTDTLASLRAALFGFEVGGLRISLGQLLAAILLFVAGYAGTRLVQRWLERRFLPKTDLDVGLKSSLNTGLGYLGIGLAALAACAYLGFSLDRIAVLAGALSLGIGFGLQSIVNNFVSGIILLAERPIKPGDWVALGTDEGNVARISVRSTEVTLFDGSTLVVPNADLITKPVRNVTLRGTAGRVKVDFGVVHGSDPDRVHEIALTAAKEHRAVLASPEPTLQLTGFRDVGMSFSLFCYVASPRLAAQVRSDIAFAVVRGLQGAEIKMG
jgi:potassium-dependent mechanosensitive channel